MGKINFSTPPEFGQKIVVYHKPIKWEEMPLKDFLSMTLKDIFEGNNRFLIQFQLYNKTAYLASQWEDKCGLQKKYPDSLVIYLPQVLNLLKNFDLPTDTSKVLLACGILGATIQ